MAEGANSGKLEILPGHAEDFSACTFVLHNEDHTLGNALRYIIMKNPKVEFCGYSAPHPSEDKIHLRIQMYDNLSAIEALSQGCTDLEDMTTAIAEKYQESLDKKEYEWVEDTEPKIDWDTVKAKAEKNRAARLKRDLANGRSTTGMEP